jgi:hypothetical protein
VVKHNLSTLPENSFRKYLELTEPCYRSANKLLLIYISLLAGKVRYDLHTLPENSSRKYLELQSLVTRLRTNCYKSVHKLSTSCARTACSQVVVTNLEQCCLATCNKLDGIISQTCYKVVLTSLLQP